MAEDKDLKEVENSEKKEYGKSDRKQMKDDKLDAMLTNKASKYGVDLSKGNQYPLTSNTKKTITDNIKKMASEDIAKDIDSYSKAYTGPKFEEKPELNKDRMRGDLKRQRTARWTDAMSAFGAGLSGRPYDKERSLSRRLEREQDAEFQNFKNITEKNKQVSQVWEEQYRNDMMKFLDDKIKDGATTEREKLQLENLKAQIKRTQAQEKYYNRRPGTTSSSTKIKPTYTKQLEDGTWQVTNQGNPYSDLYYKMAGNSPTIINELAKQAGYGADDEGQLKKNLSSDEVERFSNTLLSSMFDMQEDADGNLIAIPKPGKEGYLNNMMDIISERSDIENQLKQLQTEYDTSYSGASKRNKDDVREKYDPQIRALEQQIQEANKSIQFVLSGGGSSSPTPKPSPSPQSNNSGATTAIDEIAAKYK